MKKKLLAGLATGMFMLGIIAMAEAAPTFYLNPGANPYGDIGFQNAVAGLDFSENDFNSYSNRSKIRQWKFDKCKCL